MPLTQLDEVPALVIIDLQKVVAGLPLQEVIQRSAQLARAFRERKLPVVLVNAAGRAPGRTDAGPMKFALPPDWTELLPELDRQPDDYTITKERFGAFIGTELDAILRRCGVTQVFLTGVATSIGVESTARSAYDFGYNVVFVSDAMADSDAAMHRHSVEKLFPRIGEVTTTESVLDLLASRS